MKKNKIILLITLILLLLSVSYAAETSNTTTSNEDTPTTVQTSTQRVEQSVIKEEPIYNKEIKKQIYENQSIKSGSTEGVISTVSDYSELVSKFKDAKESEFNNYHIILKKGNYIHTGEELRLDFYLNLNLTIDCNGSTIDGRNYGTFVNIEAGNTLTLKNGIFINFTDSVIENNGDYSIITNNTFKNNQFVNNFLTIGGAAIINGGDNVIIKNNIFENNTSDYGGAINIKDGKNIQIKNNTFKDNKATEHGGAIFVANYGFDVENTSITNNVFIKNTAIGSGGAIYTYAYQEIWLFGAHNTTINKNTFINNSAYRDGLAIYNLGENTKINNNTFKDNKATSNIKTTLDYAQYYLMDGVPSYNNIIYNNGENCEETNNIFGDKIITKLTITVPTTQYNNNITITGTITDKNGITIPNTPLKIKINNKTVTVKTNNEGIYKYITKAKIIGKNNVTINYTGNNKYNATNTKKSFTVTKATTKATITKIAQKTYKQNMTITGKLTTNTGTILKNTNIKVKVNSKTYTVKTNSKGIYTLKVAANKVGTNNVTVTYSGNKNYKAVTKKTTFKTVARATKLIVNKINTTTKGKKVKITGKLTDNLKSPVMNSLVKIKINKKTVTVKTNKQGVYTYNYKTTLKGTNTVTITFAGSTNYKKTSVKTSFTVK